MLTWSWPKAVLILHIAVESAAAASFILQPSSQLHRPSAATKLILQSLGGLLLSTNLICAVFVVRPVFDDTSRLVAAALGFWHMWPCRRAWVRITTGVDGDKRDPTATRSATSMREQGALMGPRVHLLVHSMLLALLCCAAVAG